MVLPGLVIRIPILHVNLPILMNLFTKEFSIVRDVCTGIVELSRNLVSDVLISFRVTTNL